MFIDIINKRVNRGDMASIIGLPIFTRLKLTKLHGKTQNNIGSASFQLWWISQVFVKKTRIHDFDAGFEMKIKATCVL